MRIIFIIVSLLLICCHSEAEAPVSEGKLGISVIEDTVSFNPNSQTLTAVNTILGWNIELDYKGEQRDWCEVLDQSGNQAVLKCSENRKEEERYLSVIVTSGGQRATIDIIQRGSPVSDIVNGWLELPSVGIGEDELFISHHMDLQGRKQRNYSMLFDKQERIAYWVAYPLHKIHLSGVSRRDRWNGDPKIAKTDQLSNTIPGYHIGHQIPSADRLCSYQANDQTFYYSNATPQIGSGFNQRVWRNLEAKVRGYTNSCDTLYIVTGAVLQRAGVAEKTKYVEDKNGQKAALPNYYFKAILRLKIEGSQREYDAVGFWFEHKAHSNSKPSYRDMRSIDDLESLLGYDLFNALPTSIQDEIENKLEPTKWGFTEN